MTIQAIETHYKGYRFRSRLEARWAVFFDALGIEWEYEKEGYNLGEAGYYLPDFWLPQVSMWGEVKPDVFTSDERLKCVALVRGTTYPCLMLIGVPQNKPYWAIERTEWKGEPDDLPDDLWECDYCLTMYHDYPIQEGRFYCMPSDDDEFDDTEKASIAARSARFEYGEKP